MGNVVIVQNKFQLLLMCFVAVALFWIGQRKAGDLGAAYGLANWFLSGDKRQANRMGFYVHNSQCNYLMTLVFVFVKRWKQWEDGRKETTASDEHQNGVLLKWL